MSPTLSGKLKAKKTDWSYIGIFILLSAGALIVLYPFYNCILLSIIPKADYIRTPFMLFPKRISFSSYQMIFEGKRMLIGYKTTLTILLLGLPYNMILCVCTAYSLSKKWFPGKKIIVSLIIFTMFFNGGMIPTYLVVRGLGLMNSIWSVILIYGVNTFYMIIMRNYFETIPESIEESAKIDGANDLVILSRIILPMSKPILATFVLFFAVDRWNEWFYAMLFIRKSNIMPLQLILRGIVYEMTGEQLISSVSALQTQVFSKGIKMAAVVVTMAPIMLVYPFLQKYFVKGMLVGSVKS